MLGTQDPCEAPVNPEVEYRHDDDTRGGTGQLEIKEMP